MDEKTRMQCCISAYDFSIWELELFLDTHSCDTRALEMRKEYQAKREALIAEYECKFGPYIVNSNQVTGDRWSWVDNPWPWDLM